MQRFAYHSVTGLIGDPKLLSEPLRDPGFIAGFIDNALLPSELPRRPTASVRGLLQIGVQLLQLGGVTVFRNASHLGTGSRRRRGTPIRVHIRFVGCACLCRPSACRVPSMI